MFNCLKESLLEHVQFIGGETVHCLSGRTLDRSGLPSLFQVSQELLGNFDGGVLPQGLLNPFLEKIHVQGLQGVGLIVPSADSVHYLVKLHCLKVHTLKDQSRLLLLVQMSSELLDTLIAM